MLVFAFSPGTRDGLADDLILFVSRITFILAAHHIWLGTLLVYLCAIQDCSALDIVWFLRLNLPLPFLYHSWLYSAQEKEAVPGGNRKVHD
jgi:hypothetical protein